MITFIGFYNSAIGFGMCGVDKVHEVTEKTSAKEILTLITNADSGIILIDNQLYEKVEKDVPKNKVFIRIPDRFTDASDSGDMEQLVKDTIGISIKVN